MRTRKVASLGLLLCIGTASSAEAARKVLVVGAGDCREPTLTTSVKQFHDEARALLKTQLFEPDVVLDAVRARPQRSLQDVQRQVDSARTLLYGGENERGLELVRQALLELDKASPQVNPWPVTTAALLVQSQLYKNLDRAKDANEAYRRVLRIDPSFALDPDAYPPSTLQAFEAVRKEVTRAKKATLVVQSTPAGASVFVDGKELGKTPLKLELVPGSYRLGLMQDGRVSFRKPVEVKDLRRETTLQVDMAFEGAVSQQPPLCVSAADDDQARKLGALMVADEVIVVRNAATPGNPPYVTAVLYDASGHQSRNGGAGPEAIGNLATFIVTGEQREGVHKGTTPPAPEVVAVTTTSPDDAKATLEPKKDSAPAPRLQPSREPEPPAPLPPDVSASGPSTARIASYVLLGAGVATAVGGLIVYGTGAGDRDALASLTLGDGRLYPPGTSNHDNAVALMPRIDANRALAFTLLGAGAGVAVAGILGVVLFPGQATQVAVFPTGQGGALSVSGQF